jgi:Icc-related predicted phosphoesterase
MEPQKVVSIEKFNKVLEKIEYEIIKLAGSITAKKRLEAEKNKSLYPEILKG